MMGHFQVKTETRDVWYGRCTVASVALLASVPPRAPLPLALESLSPGWISMTFWRALEVILLQLYQYLSPTERV